MKISVRKATINDYNILRELFDELDTFHRDNLPHLFQKTSGPVREQDYYSELIADKNTSLFVAELGEKLVGFVHAIIRDTPVIPIFVPRRYTIIDSILVKSEFQNHGIGRKLINVVQEWAITKGATSIELNVYEFNKTAISFYEKLGYHPYSRKMSKKLKLE